MREVLLSCTLQPIFLYVKSALLVILVHTAPEGRGEEGLPKEEENKGSWRKRRRRAPEGRGEEGLLKEEEKKGSWDWLYSHIGWEL